MALEAAGAWKAAAAPKVEARRSLECIFLWVVCLRAVRASRAGGAGAWSRVVVCCRGGRGGVVECSLSAASIACSVCVMLGKATVMVAAAPRRVPVARGVVDISMSATPSASRGRECVSSLAKPARCFARAPRRPRQVPWARARGVTRIAARIPNASRAGVGARSRFSPRLRIIVLC